MSKELLRYAVTQFAGDGFSSWAFRIKSILRENDVLDAIESATYHTIAQNAKNESKAQAIIIAGMADSHLEYIKRNSAYEMFENLKLNFQKKGTRSKLFVRRKLSDTKYIESESLSQHFVKMEQMFSELQEAETEISEEEKVNYILLSMPESYDGIITALETMSELKVDFVKNRLLGEEEKRKKNNKVTDQTFSNSFLCFNCGKAGHKKFQCKQAQGCTLRQGHQNYEQNRNNNNQGQGYGYNTGRGQGYNTGRGQGYNTGRGQGYNTGRGQGYNTGRGQAYNSRRGNNRGQGRGNNNWRDPQAFGAENQGSGDVYSCVSKISEVKNRDRKMIYWCVDSGCSDHLVNNRDYFMDYIELKVPKNIAAAKNDVMIQAIGVGNILVKCFVGKKEIMTTVKNVYYVPELRKNLLSVSKIESSGLEVSFSNGKVRVYNKNCLILIGNLEGNLYNVVMELCQSSCNYSMTDECEINLWHRRFGHLGVQNVTMLAQKNLVHGLGNLKNNKVEHTLCEPCLLGKMTRKHFNKTGYRAIKPLEIVHSDVCGPMTPTDREGNKYFVTFIDDFTHFVMVYLIKEKSEVFKKFQDYYYYVTNYFNTNMLTVRSDNGGEYVSNEFKNFCEGEGIRMQYTVPYNPEMNGVAERMNRTLVEKSRTILLDSGLDRTFWGDAILYSAYVTNRSPSSGRELTAREMWTGRKPDVSNMRVFGCVAYNHIPRQQRRKLDNTGKKMIMIGYTISGYKLYDMEENKVVNARNVIFDEKLKEEKTVYLPNERNIDFTDEGSSLNQENSEIIIQGNVKNEQEVRENNIQELEQRSEEPEDVRSRRRKQNPVWHKDYVINFDEENDKALYALLSMNQEDVPSSYQEVEERQDKLDWKRAIKEEIEILEESKTWKIVYTPMEVNYKYDENSVIDTTYELQCRSLIGSLMYATVGSRPDLAIAVCYLSRFQSKPSENLWRALKRILRYVKQTLYYSLIYSKSICNTLTPLKGYADADWARDNDRKSTSGYLFKLFNNTIVWRSKKQTTVALSTTEAELVSLCESVVEACWIVKVLSDLNVKFENVLIYEDNQSTMKTVKNPDQCRLKHMDIKYNFVKQKVEEGLINVAYINTRFQLADMLTKPLPKNQFVKLVKELGMKMYIEGEC